MKSSTSFVCGTSDQPLIYQTIGDALDQVVEKWGDKEAIVVSHQGVRWSYRQLAEAIDAFAAGNCVDQKPGREHVEDTYYLQFVLQNRAHGNGPGQLTNYRHQEQ